MGWNTIYDLTSPIFSDVKEHEYMYFVHSYFAELSEFTAAKCCYVNEFSASLHKDNFYAVQFHAEKSAIAGSQLLANFLCNQLDLIKRNGFIHDQSEVPSYCGKFANFVILGLCSFSCFDQGRPIDFCVPDFIFQLKTFAYFWCNQPKLCQINLTSM